MKTIYLISFITLLSISFSNAQQSSMLAYSNNYAKHEDFAPKYPDQFLKQEVKNYTNMKITGASLLIAGFAPIIGGHVMIGNNDILTAEGLIGFGLIGLGGTMIISGIVIFVLANSKIKKKLQVQLLPTGALLSYRF